MSSLKILIKEILDNSYIASEEELKSIISKMEPDWAAEYDYVDDDTGEIVLEKGVQARFSHLHPQYEIDKQIKQQEKQIAYNQEFDNDQNIMEQQLDTSIVTFVESIDVEDLRQFEDIESAVTDIAENYFWQYPGWKTWAADCVPPRKKSDIKMQIAEMIYEKSINSK